MRSVIEPERQIITRSYRQCRVEVFRQRQLSTKSTELRMCGLIDPICPGELMMVPAYELLLMFLSCNNSPVAIWRDL